MTLYLISFPSSAMTFPDEELPAVAAAAHQVVREARQAGVLVCTGGLDEQVQPLRVSADGSTSQETYAETTSLNGGMALLELPNQEAAIQWAAKIARACRCDQELRQFMYDPEH